MQGSETTTYGGAFAREGGGKEEARHPQSAAKSQFLIGAASSGSGKTTFTLGLLRALRRRGQAVAPFKCGPDYIDPQYHRLAAGRESVNLDGYLASERHLKALYARHAATADTALVEGVMGLFDGWRADRGSSAELAQRLALPVVLVVDARSTAYSVAPLLYGYRRFRRGVELAGVVFNRVASQSHYRFLEEAARDAGVEPLGCLPRDDSFAAPSRHLGLSLENLAAFDPAIDRLADAVEAHVDLDRLLELSLRPFRPAKEPAIRRGALRIAVARDEAFNFLYRANLDRLEELGEVTFFSPLRDRTLPEADFVYLPGGYPEFHLAELARNTELRRAVGDFARSGGRMLAECGGMMYLCRAIRSERGESYPMCGVLPLEATMEGMRLHLGYREIRLGGRTLRGHEFHYSHTQGEYPSIARQFTARGEEVATPLYRYENVIAGYTHLYWGEDNPLEWF